MSYAAVISRFTRPLSQLSKPAMAALCMAALTVSGCSNQNDINADDNENDAENSALIQERFQVATDLDIEQMRKIGDAYSEETGVLIDWIPMDEQVFTVKFDEEPPLVFDIKVPTGSDMVIMHSAYTLANAKASHVLQPLGSEILNSKVPKQYQDEDGFWYGVGMYGRTLVYNHNKVNEPELINYASVGANKWQGRLCMTDVFSPENQAIAKMMWGYRGTKLTPEIVRNWQINMGAPSDSDSQVLAKIDQGLCDVGIVDSDVFWQYSKTNPNTAVRLMWANQINRGTITNAISMGMLDSGEDVGQALRFMEWLVSDEGQALFAYHTSSFPVATIEDESIDKAVIRPEWTEFSADATLLSEVIANHRKIEPAEPPEVKPKTEEAEDEADSKTTKETKATE